MKTKLTSELMFFFLISFFLSGFINLNLDRKQTNSFSYYPAYDSIKICRNGLNKPIYDNQSTFDTIHISGLPAQSTVLMVEITIDTIIHTWDADLEITLWKGSTRDTLIKDRGGSGQNFIGTNLTDTAIISIANGVAPFTGYYRAEFPLSIFNGLDPNGNWILEIYDDASGDQGTLKAWCIKIHYESPSGVNNQSSTPKEYTLYQNYPNPFNPVTEIGFSMPKSGLVTLDVFDISGKYIMNLVNGFKNTGNYVVEFDGNSLSSGIYYYKMQAGNFSAVKKMLLIK